MATDLSDLLTSDLVLADLSAASKKMLFQQVATIAAPLLDLAPGVIVDGLLAREKLGTTGFGGGTAIPHAKIDGLPRIVAIAVRLAQAIEFKAVDDVPIDLAIVLLSPPDAGAEHLKALARVSRCLRDRAFVDKLRGAGSRDALYALLTDHETRDAA